MDGGEYWKPGKRLHPAARKGTESYRTIFQENMQIPVTNRVVICCRQPSSTMVN